MFPASHSFPQGLRLFGLMVVAGFMLVSCGPPANTVSQAPPYDRAKAAFKNSQLGKVVELTDSLATAKPAVDTTERAQVLRAVVFAGQVKGAKELAEAYSKGAEKSKDSQTQAGYQRAQQDALLIATKAAMGLAETAREIEPNGVIAKELTLEASFPDHRRPHRNSRDCHHRKR